MIGVYTLCELPSLLEPNYITLIERVRRRVGLRTDMCIVLRNQKTLYIINILNKKFINIRFDLLISIFKVDVTISYSF
ncbi:hypothetical protein GFV14_00571 [Candidatus Hartigia pinicola]|nr:hypothetical protein GFV14_00571 [Candidatus Hartigia pinicola]